MLQAEVTTAEEPVVDDPAEGELPKLTSLLKMHQPGNPLGSEQKFWLLGTAHVSARSSQDVRRLVRAVKPQVVMIELCPARRGILTVQKLKVPTAGEMVAQVRQGQATVFQVAYAWLLARLAEHLEVMPGEEFRVALQEAQACGARICFGDRPVQVTLARVWAALGLWSRIRLLWSVIGTGVFLPDADEMRNMVEGLKEADVMTEAFKELGREFPQIMAPLIYERDQYMVAVMRQLASSASRVVAVVGAGHLEGIRSNWEADINVEEISQLPPPRRSVRSYLLLASGLALSAVVVVRWRRHVQS